MLLLCAASPVHSAIQLTDSNHIGVTGPVTDRSVRRWTRELTACTADPMYVYINSPGGSVVAGHGFVNALRHKKDGGQKVVCIAEFAASMAFIILQACEDRVVMDHSIAMQHQMSLVVGGSLGASRSRMALAEQMESAMVSMQARRLGLEESEFREMTRDDWWLYGSNIVNKSVADRLDVVGCTPALSQSAKTKCPITSKESRLQHTDVLRLDPDLVLLPLLNPRLLVLQDAIPDN